MNQEPRQKPEKPVATPLCGVSNPTAVADRGLFFSCSGFATDFHRRRGEQSRIHLQITNAGKPRRERIMLHLIWYILVGLIAGVIAKSVMHVHMTIFWTIVLGIIGSIIGGAVTHMFSPPTTGRFHPAGIIFSTLGAILVLYVCIKLHIRFPRVL